MITQHNEYGSISSDIQNLIANKVSLLDQYILMQTGDYEYTALIYNPNTKKSNKVVITRSSSSYSSTYSVTEQTIDNFDYTVSNQYYVFSNVGYGKSLDLPVYDGVISHSLIIISLILMFGVVFKGALFKIFKRK